MPLRLELQTGAGGWGWRAEQGIYLHHQGRVQGEGEWGVRGVLLPDALPTRAGARRLLLYV